MTYAEKLCRLAYYTLAAIIAGTIAAAGWHLSTPPRIDPRTGSAGLSVETDAGTGCQFVVTPWGGIFARLDSAGKPLCTAPKG